MAFGAIPSILDAFYGRSPSDQILRMKKLQPISVQVSVLLDSYHVVAFDGWCLVFEVIFVETMPRWPFLWACSRISRLYHSSNKVIIVGLHFEVLFLINLGIPYAICFALGRLVRKSKLGGGRLSICGLMQLKVFRCFRYCFSRFLLSSRRLAAITFHIFDYKM